MIKKKNKHNSLEIISITIAALSVLFALWANVKSAESNRISREAINISATANALAEKENIMLWKDSNPHPRIVDGPEYFPVYKIACNYGDINKPYGVIMATTPGFEIVNYGAQSIWLQDIVWDENSFDWNISVHEAGVLVGKNYDLKPDTVVKWNIVALHQKAFSNKQEASDYLQNLPYYLDVDVRFLFEDDQEKTWPFVLTLYASENIQDFSTSCREHLMFFYTQY